MVKRLLGVCAVAGALLGGCGAPPPSKIDPRIVGNNAAGWRADAARKDAVRKDAVRKLAYGELDVEALARRSGIVLAPTRTPGRPTAPEPIRPKPQGAAEGEPAGRHDLAWLDRLDRVAGDHPDLGAQADLLRETPGTLLDLVHEGFSRDLDALAPDAARELVEAWRVAGPDERLRRFEAKLEEVRRPGAPPG